MDSSMIERTVCLLGCLALAACAARRDGLPPEARSGAVGFQDISGLTRAPGGRVSLAQNETYL